MNSVLASATVVAETFTLDRDTVTPGVLGFLVIFAIGVCLYLLMRSMTSKLDVVRKDVNEPAHARIRDDEKEPAAEGGASDEQK
ncbi:hypothetical protein [Nocardiopsis algeriensis]|uniref:Uncharacterized protein n=1 Tax=Nocardiopsis algeriensis TaxID=1478215 RepID=A0A841IUJ3_9ACTN|nr:hypothetical protein [Nocardiopsis algeriensis]MBB6120215.1 hypothetical protein [Nocardiopsis algeriensis]